MPIGALAATFIMAVLISFTFFTASPLPDPDKDKKDKKKENGVGSIFNNYFVKPMVTAISMWIIFWLFMVFWGFVPDDFWQTGEEKSDLVQRNIDQQKEIDSLKKVAADQDQEIKKAIRSFRTIARILEKLKKKYPITYKLLSDFAKDS